VEAYKKEWSDCTREGKRWYRLVSVSNRDFKREATPMGKEDEKEAEDGSNGARGRCTSIRFLISTTRL
jgi:hypothetical protein